MTLSLQLAGLSDLECQGLAWLSRSGWLGCQLSSVKGLHDSLALAGWVVSSLPGFLDRTNGSLLSTLALWFTGKHLCPGSRRHGFE